MTTQGRTTNDAATAAWIGASTAVLSALDRPELPQRLLEALAVVGPFDLACSFVYRPNAAPIHVHDSFADPAHQQGLINYTNSTYVLNPFYGAYLRGLRTGAYRMRDLAPDAYAPSALAETYQAQASGNEEIGYLTHGWPAGMEELCLALALDEGECAEISLSRPIAKGFSDADVAAFDRIVPFIAEAYRRYWQASRPRHLAATRDSGADAAFAGFGGDLLSPREREIAQLLLRGHSSLSISSQLGISGTTVKTHRKNLYAKLGIATHYELFSCFLDSLRKR
jgi:DNA-binding CsgD family transcriptional regulator